MKSDLTDILNRLSRGDSTEAEEQAVAQVYGELLQLARAKFARENPGQTLQATALVHEAFIRLLPKDAKTWENRRHFFGAAALAMKRILIEHARKRRSRAELDFELVAGDLPAGSDLIDLDDVLSQLRERDARACEVVHLRYFVGLSIEETAEILSVSPRTVRADWTMAKAWMRSRLRRGLSEGDSPGV